MFDRLEELQNPESLPEEPELPMKIPKNFGKKGSFHRLDFISLYNGDIDKFIIISTSLPESNDLRCTICLRTIFRPLACKSRKNGKQHLVCRECWKIAQKEGMEVCPTCKGEFPSVFSEQTIEMLDGILIELPENSEHLTLYQFIKSLEENETNYCKKLLRKKYAETLKIYNALQEEEFIYHNRDFIGIYDAPFLHHIPNTNIKCSGFLTRAEVPFLKESCMICEKKFNYDTRQRYNQNFIGFDFGFKCKTCGFIICPFCFHGIERASK